jgi:exosortase
MVLATKLLVVIVPVIVIYFQDLELVFRESLANDFMNYVLILPFLIGYIVYRKRKMLQAVSPLGNDEQEKQIMTSQVLGGITLLAVSFLTYFFGSYTSYALEYHLLSLPLFVAGSIALVFNLETLKTLLFPIALLFFIQPYLIQLISSFWADLSWISSTAAYNLLTSLRIPARFTTVYEIPTIEITTVTGETIPFTVGVASSGLNSLVGFTVFSIFLAYIIRGSLWKRVTLVLIGYPLVVLLNAFRITIILSLAYQWGITVAEIFHLTGGWVLIFIGTILLLFLGEKVLRVGLHQTKPQKSNCTYCDESRKNGYNLCLDCGRLLKTVKHTITKKSALRLSLVILIAFSLVLVQAPPIALAKSPTQMELATISTQLESGTLSAEESRLLPTIPSWSLRFLYRNTQIEQILSQDAALLFAYKRDVLGNQSYAYIFVSVDISTGRHTWESSLITYGSPPITVLDTREVPIFEDRTLMGKLLVYQWPQSNLTEVVLYWFERVAFKIDSIWNMRNVQISLWSRSYDLARSGLISNETDYAGVEKWYLSISHSIADYWEPIKTSSQIASTISQNGNGLLITAGLLLTGAATLCALERRTRRRANAAAYEKLSSPNKGIINILHQTETNTAPTLNSIADKYLSTTGKKIGKEKLLRKLLEVEKIGLIKSYLVSKQDEPVQIWKTQFSIQARPDS